jgi:hypothetical protein
MKTNILLHACYSQAIAQLEQAEYIHLCNQLTEQSKTGEPLEDSNDLKDVKLALSMLKILRSSL